MQALKQNATTSLDVAVAPMTAAPIELVKWATPTEELVGVAKVVRHLVGTPGVSAGDVCIAAPNRVWARQAQLACASVGLEAALCAPADRLSAPARVAMAKLAVLAQPDAEPAREAWVAAGLPEADAAAFAQAYGKARGFTLVRVLGLEKVPEAAVALLHVRGDEGAAQLRELLASQLANPELPEHSAAVPVRVLGSLSQPCELLFLVGCVDGLVPGEVPGHAAQGEQGAGALAACEETRAAFRRALGLARSKAVVSFFSKVDEQTAQRAHVRCTRFKMEHGQRMGLAAPTPFLDEVGGSRPTTVGGQAYLRSFDLN